MEEIVLKIKTELKNRKITYDEFSKITGIPTGTLRNIFSNRGINPRIDTINTMLDALGINQYVKSPSGTVLTQKEQQILDLVCRCDEIQQAKIHAYIQGLQDEHKPLGNVIVKRAKPDNMDKSG